MQNYSWEKGSIVENGSLKTLLENQGKFYELWKKVTAQ